MPTSWVLVQPQGVFCTPLGTPPSSFGPNPVPLTWYILRKTSLSSSHASRAPIALCFCPSSASGPKGHGQQRCGPEGVRLWLLPLPLEVRPAPCQPPKECSPAAFPHQPPPRLQTHPKSQGGVLGQGQPLLYPDTPLSAFSDTSTPPAAPPEREWGRETGDQGTPGLH